MPSAAHAPRSLTTCAPIIICGMHRSGTSLIASMLVDSGVHLGHNLLGPSSGNSQGHFEDTDILEFHRNVLLANGIVSEGYTTQLQIPVPESLKCRAASLVAARTGSQTPWGWKEPRTTLFLDFWSQLLPKACYLFMFRRPWEVIDSLLRRNETTFHWNPSFAIDVWTHYNRRLLEFVQRHADVSVLCELTQVVECPAEVFDQVRRRFRLPIAEPAIRYQPRLLRQDDHASRPTLLANVCPQAYELYLELRDIAQSRSALPECIQTPSVGDELRVHLFNEWGRATQHMLRCHEAEHRLEQITDMKKHGWRRFLSKFGHRPKVA
jgi:hypothetical protein